MSNEETTEVEVEYNESPEGRAGATNAFKIAVANFIGTQGNSISLHSVDPDDGTKGELTVGSGNAPGYARKTTTWGTASVGGDGRATITGSAVTFDVPGGVGINYYGVWNGTTFLYGKALQPGAQLTASGKITVTPTHSYGLL